MNVQPTHPLDQLLHGSPPPAEAPRPERASLCRPCSAGSRDPMRGTERSHVRLIADTGVPVLVRRTPASAGAHASPFSLCRVDGASMTTNPKIIQAAKAAASFS